MAKKPAVPGFLIQDPVLSSVISAIKENIEIITGSRLGVGEIKTLPSDASTGDIINKINEIAKRLNVSGN